jgi:hypothetical protein
MKLGKAEPPCLYPILIMHPQFYNLYTHMSSYSRELDHLFSELTSLVTRDEPKYRAT